MRSPTTDTLAVPGARLYYEVRGSGPPVLIVPTGNGDAEPFRPVADQLSDRFTVITYDRRGYSRSPIIGDFDNDQRLMSEADDARRLIEHVAGAPAHVFGSSSGAIVGLALIEHHPGVVATAIVHEAPLASLLPDAADWLRFYADLYATFHTSGVEAARLMFRNRMGMAVVTRPPKSTQLPPAELAVMLERLARNQLFWFENEIRTYPAYLPDIGVLKARSDRLVLAGGMTSREDFPYRPNAALAEMLGMEIVHFPGGHGGYVTHPTEFVEAFARLLSVRDTADV